MEQRAFSCPKCGQVLRPAQPLQAGQKIRCSRCQAVITAVLGSDGIQRVPAAPRPLPKSENVTTHSAQPGPDQTEGSFDFYTDDTRAGPVPRKAKSDRPGGIGQRKTRGASPRRNFLIPALLGGGGVLAAVTVLLIVVLSSSDQPTLPLEPKGPAALIQGPKKQPLPWANPDPLPEQPLPPVQDRAPRGPDLLVLPKDKPAEPVKELPAGDGSLPPEILERVKSATAYLRVTWPDGRSATGSGFFAIEPGLVLTNAHVLDMLETDRKAPGDIEVVLYSGGAKEERLQGRLVAVDRPSDLAVLRVTGKGQPLPTPLAVQPAGGLLETQRVYIFGFPFGEALGKNITVSPSAVSSLRRDLGGRLKEIQVNGGMHPGNSGGPVVDPRGQVLGVAVSGLRNTQINFAIPGEQVHLLLAGRVGAPVVDEPTGDMTLKVPVRLETVDPLGRRGKVEIDWWVGKAGPERPAADQPPSALAGDGPRQTAGVVIQDGFGSVELNVTAPTVDGAALWVQPRLTDPHGKTRWLAARARPLLPSPVARDVSLTVTASSEPLLYRFTSAFASRVEAEGRSARTFAVHQRIPLASVVPVGGGKR
jgi:S1-C subfamily serine protease